MRKALVLLSIFIAFGAAWAQQRQLPESVKPGVLRAYEYPEVQIDGRWYRLSPGIRIVDQRNMSILHTMLVTGGPVAYTLDSYGFVTQLWLLSPEEAATLKPAK
ncbi:MAG TPA: hypothetical protein VLC55_00590 [Burkholderiales bacterium]|nr:hypothetical protein [Burkholderiales bacterium]